MAARCSSTRSATCRSACKAHLLRVLQERQVTPLGSAKSVAVDVSIICATHRNLREMIEQKAFREDLFYRLNGLAVRLPPLRERSDLMALVRRILDRQLGEGRADERGPRRLELTPEVVRLFERYPWPGNVRQLFNVLRTAAVMAANETVITREHLSDDFLEESRAALGAEAPLAQAEPALTEPLHGGAGMAAAAGAGAHGPFGTLAPTAPSAYGPATAVPAPPPMAAMPMRDSPASIRSLEEQEIEAIQRAVDLAGGNISEASKRLGISRNTIYRKLRWKK
ncbi:sigma 54-interacting transcriptional regulator [Paucibacter sp. O1-1]|nr:sigma 54-interacting transcriptional regulator [Paucibacter sp. O1-1]MDA3827972.1 sigma 54-interacting transcriptional regulator [Paucibacter sp. O1-1]